MEITHAEAGFDRRMNYRHAFHAGNFADVVKHAALVAVPSIASTRKPTPYRYVDTHAGIGAL
jgi:23S rRNA (adenine2030-N6)-methyltransferase